MGDPPRTRAPDDDREEQVVLAHESLKSITERVRIAWAETSEGTEPTKRAKRKLRDQCREWSGLALATLVDACMHGDTTASRVSAAKELLDRGYGKSVELVEVNDRRDERDTTSSLEALRRSPGGEHLLAVAEALVATQNGEKS